MLQHRQKIKNVFFLTVCDIINVREYRWGNQIRTIQSNWQQDEDKQNKTIAYCYCLFKKIEMPELFLLHLLFKINTYLCLVSLPLFSISTYNSYF